MFENLFVEKYRPKTLDEISLTEDLKKYVREIKGKQEIPHIMLHGTQGTGKTSLAHIIVKDILDCQYIYVNASNENGIDNIRNKITNFIQVKSFDNKLKVVIFDEADYLSSSSQAALRSLMEEYSFNSRFIMTCNYINKIFPAIISRCQTFNICPSFNDCIKRLVHILKAENIVVNPDQKDKVYNLVTTNYPDLRKMINDIQKYTINNILDIKVSNDNELFVKELYTKIISKDDIIGIRKFIIKNEVRFGNDYHQLMKDLFEFVYNSTCTIDDKRKYMLLLSEAMYKHQFVLDKEINFYDCLLKL